MSGEMMLFPATVEEFMEQYKVVDRDHAISNGAEFIPVFRMRQWFDHLQSRPVTRGDKLRAMTDKELAGLLSIYCCRNKTYDAHCETFGSCEACWQDWLKEEAKV